MAVPACRCMFFRHLAELRGIFGRISTTRAASSVGSLAEERGDNHGPLLSNAEVATNGRTAVHPHVAKILEDSKPKLIRGNWRKPKISARRLAELRKVSIAAGYYWPEKPMIDRSLDRTPKGHRYEREKAARLVRIEQNMKNMPKIIEDYRKKMRTMRTKRQQEKKEAKERSLEAHRLGVHPKDPRGIRAVRGDAKTNNKKKFQKKPR